MLTLDLNRNSGRQQINYKHQHILTPGRYVGIEEEEEDDQTFEETMKQLTAELAKQMEEGKRLDEEIKKNLKKIGWKV